MIERKFKCDACGKYFSIRDAKGAPAIVGGIEGAHRYENGSINQMSLDFCEECYAKIINFVTQLQHERK